MSTRNDDRHDQEFDQAMRRLHMQAVTEVSPATRARLRVARQAGAHGAREPRRGFGWVLASGCAAAFVLAIALQLRPTPPVATAPTQTPAVAVAPAESGYDVDTAVAALDENPDLYLWLASNDDALPAVAEQ